MKVEYKRELTGNYCVIKQLKEDVAELECGQRMLLNNEISGFLKCQLLYVDNEIYFQYEITSKQSLKQLIEVKNIGFKELENLILGILKIVASSKEYLLETSHIILLPEFIYMNPETDELSVCYCMMHEKELSGEFHKLIEYLLQKINHKDESAVMLGYEIYRKSLEENYVLEELLEIMKQSYHLNSTQGNKFLKEQIFINESKLMKESTLIKEPTRINESTRAKEFTRINESTRAEESIRAKEPARINESTRAKELTRINESTRAEEPARIKDSILAKESIRAKEPARIKDSTLAKESIGAKEYIGAKESIRAKEYIPTKEVIFIKESTHTKKSTHAKNQIEDAVLESEKQDFSSIIDEESECSRIQILLRKLCQAVKNKVGNKTGTKIRDKKEFETPYMALPEEEGSKKIGNTTYFGQVIRNKQARLEAINGEYQKVIYLDQEVNVIGKLDCCTIILEGNTISRLHARITKKEEEVWIEDLNSTNGTFVNGAIVGKEEVLLRENDKIKFGGAEYNFFENVMQ